ncbi:putative membrane protein YagU involved in acid resistance [Mucilaginibacter sp. OAE612]|uniref:hypothetical protein n=1 Tax=Mucilaginibacter sp. OAE612 TaxID=3156444 RepID=UPI00359F0110
MRQNILADTEQKIGAARTILTAGIIAGILDSMAASVVFYFKLGLSPAQVMQYIASAIYGAEAFSGGTTTVIIGTLLHLMIAFVIAAVYFYLYPVISPLRKWPVISGLLLGIAIWLFMNLVIIPFSKIQPAPVELSAVVISVIWHLVLVGLPISLITKRHFENGGRLN